MTFFIWTFILATVLFRLSDTATDDKCDGPPAPCVCEGAIIDCNNKKFHSVPTLIDPNNHYDILDIGGNALNRIDTRPFENIAVHTILLNGCNLSHINENAFAGREQDLKKLDLSDNLLGFHGSLPNFLVHLRKLEYLDVSGNGFRARDYTDYIMRSIGASVTTFIFGDSFVLTEWPTGLRHLQQLVNLKVNGGFLPIIPFGAFHGFEVTLRTLTFNNITTYTVPLGIASLRNLTELHMDNLLGFGDSSLTEQPFQGVGQTLKTLSLKNDGLTIFPSVIKHLVNLKELTLDNNKLDFISDESIALLQQRNVTLLSLKQCDLSRVPGAISNIQGLQTLDLSNNKITSIEQNDVQMLPNLITLKLAGNPLKYVSNSSFIGLDKLQILDLSSTDLTVISQAIEHLVGLLSLDLSSNKLDCTCDLVWLKRFFACYRKVITIHGDCESIYMTIEDYVNMFVPNCLAYRDSTCG